MRRQVASRRAPAASSSSPPPLPINAAAAARADADAEDVGVRARLVRLQHRLAAVLVRGLHDLLVGEIVDAAEQLGIPHAADVVQQHDLLGVRFPPREEGRGVDRAEGPDALGARVELAEAVHDALAVRIGLQQVVDVDRRAHV